MARDDLFRRSFEAGTAFLDMTRERAEALVKELVKAGEVRKGKAQKLVDEVIERSRKGTEDLRHLIRKEISELGLATKDDIARIEAQLAAMSPSDAAPTSSPAPTNAPPVKRAGATKTAAPAKKAPARKAAAPAADTTAPAATDAGTPDAGTTGPDAEPTADEGRGGPPSNG